MGGFDIFRQHQPCAGRPAKNGGKQHEGIKHGGLVVEQAKLLIEADRGGGLFRRDRPVDKQDGNGVQVGFGENPAQVEQRVLTRQFDESHQCQKRDGCRQQRAKPPGFEPPVEPAERQHDCKATETARKQEIAEDIHTLDHLRTRRRCDLEDVNHGEGNQRETDLHRIKGIPAIDRQQRG